ncbi:hypothetical protein NEK97_04850 [Paenarthrobacter sp. UW852]|uniref:hypothetical protein n=1 Tax=Paenarthrobacter sp. UW852 TaxID=2951989 RepID=UPI002148683F|nr:hypothetical protein [Paenarthrobacter sp. UW852]MCR1160783.1 hypothetical protein [Paenarthrobacter sp. UW852]
MTEGSPMKRIPSPLQVVLFFVMAVIFATWQPLVWWRGVGAAVMLAGGIYGWWLLRRSKRKQVN